MQHLKTLKKDIWGALGFMSFSDFFSATTTIKIKFVVIHLYSISISGILVVFKLLEEQTDRFVYSPAAGIVLLFLVSLVDFMLGAANSKFVRNEDFQPTKIPRSAVRFGVQTFFVGIFFNMNKVWPLVIQFWITDFLLIVFILTTVWSGIVNAKNLKLITEDQYSFLEKFVNPSKFFKRMFNKNQD